MSPIPLHHVWQYSDVDRVFWQERLEEWMPGRIFDAHTHVNEPEYLLYPPSEEKLRQYDVTALSPVTVRAA